MLVRTVDRGVDRHGPLHHPDRVVADLDFLEQAGLGPVRFPPGEPLIDRLPRPEPFRQVTPWSTRPQPPQHPADHLPVIPPRPTKSVEIHPLNQSAVDRPRQRVVQFWALNVRRWDRIVAAGRAGDDRELDEAWADQVVDLGSQWRQYEYVTNVSFAA